MTRALSPGQVTTISTRGGNEPVWAPDGRELFFRREDEVLAVAVDTTGVFRAGAPEVLFTGGYAVDNSRGGGGVLNYVVAPDGRFLMLKLGGEADQASPTIAVVLNWHQELLERVR